MACFAILWALPVLTLVFNVLFFKTVILNEGLMTHYGHPRIISRDPQVRHLINLGHTRNPRG